jgi:hypothetical protein
MQNIKRYGLFALVGTFLMVMTSFHALAGGYSTTISVNNLPMDVYLPGGFTAINIVDVHEKTTLHIRINNNYEYTDISVNGIKLGQLNPYGDDLIIFQITGPSTINLNPSMWTYLHIEKMTTSPIIIPPLRVIGKLYPGFGSQSGMEINLEHYYPWVITQINGTSSSELNYRAFVNEKISGLGKFNNDSLLELKGCIDKFQLLGPPGATYTLDIADNWPQYHNQMTYSVGTVNVTATSSGDPNVFSKLKTETVAATDLFVSSYDIAFSEDHPTAGDNITISTQIYSGFAALNHTKVRFYDGFPSSDNQIGSDKIVDLIPQLNYDYRSAEVNITWQARPGTHDIYIVVDPDCEILEENRDDNTAYASIHVTFPFHIQKNDQTPLSNLQSYIFSINNQYQGIAGISDQQGTILFDLDKGDYKIATDYLGKRYFTGTINIPQTRNYTLVIAHQNTTVTVYGNYSGKIEPVANVPVYLFSVDSSYLNLFNYTDSVGNATFNIPIEIVKFRTDYLNKNYWSAPSQDNRTNIEIPLGMVTLTVTNSVSLTNVPIYVFDLNNQYVGIDKYTNSSGNVTFTLPEGEYKFRADTFGSQYFSDIIMVNRNILKTVDFKVGGGLLTLNVSIQDGMPITYIPIYVFSEQYQYLGKYGFTNSTGLVSFDLPSGNYRFRADYLGYSFFSTIASSPGSLDLIIKMYSLKVAITDGVSPLSNIPIYLFKDNSYLGLYCYSNSNGQCSLSITNQTYRFRYDYMGFQYWSEDITTSSDIVIDKVIQHKIITIRGMENFQDISIPIVNAPVYLFSSDNNYLGKYSYTNETGFASFNVPSNVFKFRLDFLGESYWSEPVIWQNVTINIHAGESSIQIINDTIPKSGIPVYVFLSNGQYLGLYNYTNSSGIADFILPENAYLFRADFAGAYHWTNIINVTRDLRINIPVGESSRSSSRSTDFIIQLKKNNAIPIHGVPVFAFEITGETYTGIYGFTDQQGTVILNLPDGDYNFRADYLGYSFFSRNVTIPLENSLNWIIPHEEVTITFQSNYLSSFEGFSVYAFTSPIVDYIGDYHNLSSTNSVTFYLPEVNYKFRLDYLGLQIWTGDTVWQNISLTINEGIVNVFVMRGNEPVSNIPVYLFNSGQNYLNRYGISSPNGTVEFILPIQSYKFRTDVNGNQFFSGVIQPISNNIVNETIQTGGGGLKIRLTDQAGNPIPNAQIYIFSNSDQYLGIFSSSDGMGIATFAISSGVFNIRVDYLGQSFWKNDSVINYDISGKFEIDFIIEHQLLNVYVVGSIRLTEGEYLMPMANVPVYIFTANGQYIGMFNYTDDYGGITFALPTCPFKFRTDYLGDSYWSEIVVADGITEVQIKIPMNMVMVSFYNEDIDSSGQLERIPISGVPIYIFDGANYLGFVQSTDQYGNSYFQLPIKVLQARADYNGKQYWSSPFMVDPETFTIVDISGATDLAISSFDINIPLVVLEDSIVSFNATVHSLGSLSANDISVRFYMDSKSNFIDETHINITAGSSQQALVYWQVPREKGIHKIIVEIDGENQIAETNENNNDANISVMIRQPYDIVLSSEYPLREYINPEISGFYYITVSNEGYFTDTITLEFTQPDSPWFAILNKTSVTLRSGESTTVQLTVYPDSDGDGINNYIEETSNYMASYSYLNKGITTSDSTTISNIDLNDQIHQLKVRTNLTLPSNVNYDVLDLKNLVKFSLTSGTNPNIDLTNPAIKNSIVFHDSEVSLNIIYLFNISGNGNYAMSASLDQNFENVIKDYTMIINDLTLYGTGLNPNEQDTDHDGIPDKQEIDLGLSPINPDTDGDGIWDGAEIDYWQSRGYTYNEGVILALIPDRDNDNLNDGVELSQYFTDPNNKDSDMDSISDGDEVNIYHTDPMNPDSDGDGMPDGWEVLNGLNPINPGDAGMDNDIDGLNNLLEYLHGADPKSKDTDKDGLNDGDELGLAETDGIPNKFITNPSMSDSDGDGMPDGWEVLNNLNPTDSSDAALDQDTDGLTALEEYHNHTNPFNPDCDGDTLLDGDEVNIYKTDPNKKDTDGDGLTDDIETMVGSNTDPLKSDTDGDDLPDGWIDLNNIGIKDAGEYEDRNLNGVVDAGAWNNGNGPGETDPSKADTDRDGMPDGWEIKYGLDPLVDDSRPDPDNDGLSNVQEYKANSDPLIPDTDGDGLTDGAEVNGHPATDPSKADTDGDGLWDGMNLLSPPPFNHIDHYGEKSYGTNPTKADTDGDKLTDFEEITNYYKYNRIETEDLAPMVTTPKTVWINQFDIKMSVSKLGLPATSMAIISSTNSPETMIQADQTKSYQIHMTGGGNVLVVGISPAVNRDFVHQGMSVVLENAANFVVYTPVNPHVPINPSTTPTKTSHLTYNNDQPTEYPFIPSSPSQEQNDGSYFWIQKYQYNLVAGNNYPVEINMNYNALNTLYQTTVDNLAGCNWGLGCANEGWLMWVNISIDYFYVEKLGLDPLNKDTDHDSLLDGWEIENLTFPFNADPDKDGISDPNELQVGTSAEDRDTDHDGLRDSVEIGNTGADVDPYTTYDTDLRNIDVDPTTTTDPLNFDTDHDNIPDGWKDGWGTNHVPGADWTFSNTSGKADMIKQRSEGEDLNCNGEVDAGNWNTGAGETDSNLYDTDDDKMPDFFEVHYYDTDGILNPLTNDASDDADNDGRTNIEEYVVDTHPNMKDTDKDGLNDYKETEVRFRTNVPNGAVSVLNYGSLDAKNEYEWIWFVNPQGNGAEYGYYDKQTDPQKNSFGGYGGYNSVQYQLPDGSSIIYDKTEERIYIWIPGSDYMDKNNDGVLHGTVHIFSVSAAQDPGQAETSSNPQISYKNQELYIANPFNKDTDGDGLKDGLESLYNEDSDGDGLINIRDTDSDNDGIPDGQEIPFAPYSWDLDVDRDGIPNMLDLDSDNDGIPDSIEYKTPKNPDGDPFPNWLDWDSDNDGMPDGWVKDSIYGYIGTFPDYYNQLITIGNGDNVRDPFEGEDLNLNGVQDPGETDMTMSDTDSDGLTDGYNYIDDYGHQQIGELSVGTDRTNPDCDHDGLLDGQEVKGWTIVVEDINQIKTTKHVTSDPWKADTDYDGVPDSLEYQFTDPREPDTDHDGTSDKLEDKNHNGKWDVGETNPLDADTDNDYLTDSIELDASDGFTTDPLNWDTDGDGLPDGWIDYNKDGARNPGEYEDYNFDGNWDYGPNVANDEPNPAKGYADSDRDGINDRTEMLIYNDVVYWGNQNNKWMEWTSDVNIDGYDNWVDSDSDGDGIPDGLEILPMSDYDMDGLPAVLDDHSAGADTTDLEHIYVTFRTNAKDTNKDGQFDFVSGTWIAINREATRSGSLTYYAYSSILYGALPNGYVRLTKSMDDSAIYWNSGDNSKIYVKLADNKYAIYNHNTAVPSGVPLSKDPVLSYGLANQERWGGTNPAMAGLDDDNDGLSNADETAYDTKKDDGDSDDDGIPDGFEVYSQTGHTDPNNMDTDGDGVQDGTEIGLTEGVLGQEQSLGLLYITTSGTDMTKFVPDTDPITKTDPNIIDSDGDGLPDGWIDGWTYDYIYKEWYQDSTKKDEIMQPWEGEDFPLTGATFGNGQFDKDRTDIQETNPTKADTDGDGLPDGLEAFYQGNPNDPTDADKDLDQDGLTLREEIVAGTFADNWDTDGDGLPDGWEIYFGLNPRIKDSSTDRDFDGLTALEEYQVGMPSDWDNAVKGVWWGGSNASNSDTDGDGIPDGVEYHVGDSNYNDADKDNIPNIYDLDSDNDGVPDEIEYKGWDISFVDHFNKKIYTHATSNPYSADTDGDGLTDDKELKYGTNPSNKDTDGDNNPNNPLVKYNDYYEVLWGDNPRWAEYMQPNFAAQPSMSWKEGESKITIGFDVLDDSGIFLVGIKLYDGDRIVDTSVEYPKTTPNEVVDSLTVELDSVFTSLTGFMVVITVIDINYNVNSEYREGGVIHDIEAPIAKYIGAWSPEAAGFVVGYYEGFLQSAWDMSFGAIPLIQVADSIYKTQMSANSAKTTIIDKTSNLKYWPKSSNDPCKGWDWWNGWVCSLDQQVLEKGKHANPFDPKRESDKFYRFQNSYGTAYIIGYALFVIASFFFGGGEAKAAEEGATAAIDAGKAAAKAGQEAGDASISRMTEVTGDAEKSVEASADFEKGATGLNDLGARSDVYRNPAYEGVSDSGKLEIADFFEKNPNFENNFPGSSSEAAKIGQKMKLLDNENAMNGIGKLINSDGISPDAISSILESANSAGQSEAATKSLDLIGRTPATWTQNSFEDLIRVADFYPESESSTWANIEKLSAKGSDVYKIVDNLGSCIKLDDPALNDALAATRDGYRAEIEVAANEIPKIPNEEIINVGEPAGSSQVDATSRNIENNLKIDNEVKVGKYYQSGLKKKFDIWDSVHPDRQKRLWVRPEYVDVAQAYCDSHFNYKYRILVKGIDTSKL